MAAGAGQPELTRDGKDIQLKPYHIMKVPHEGRKDTAPGEAGGAAPAYEDVQHGCPDGHGRRHQARPSPGDTPPSPSPTTGVAQSFPDAWHTAKGKIKILYGVEGYYVNNLDDRIAVHGPQDQNFADEIVCFDIETTGLKVEREAITEIGAVVLRNGEVAERFQTFVNPNRRPDAGDRGPDGITVPGCRRSPAEGGPDEFSGVCGGSPAGGPTTPNLTSASSGPGAGRWAFPSIPPMWTP